MSAAEDLIRTSKLDTKQVERLRNTYQRALETPSAAGFIWHGPGDIKTMAGLGGRFLWPENPLAPVTVSFTVVNVVDGSSNGTYTLAPLAGGIVEQGNFNAIPNNPLIGFAGISLTPQGANEGRGYIVEGMLTDDNGTIINMQLKNTTSQQEFWAVRISPPATA
jgi:hypothetical protein